MTSATTKPKRHSELFYLIWNGLAKVKITLSKPNSGRGERFVSPKIFHSLTLRTICPGGFWVAQAARLGDWKSLGCNS
jgi:hypothetical protein